MNGHLQSSTHLVEMIISIFCLIRVHSVSFQLQLDIAYAADVCCKQKTVSGQNINWIRCTKLLNYESVEKIFS